MTEINLRDYYPDFYKIDCIITVPDEVAAAMMEFDRLEAAYQQRTYYHKAYYSLNRGDGIEHHARFLSVSPDEIYERKVTMEQLHAAISTLPDKQAKRLIAYYFLGMSKAEIARAEGVNKSQVTRSINRALTALGKYLKNLQ